GLGYSANQGSSNSKFDGTQAFDMPPSLFSVDCPTEDVEVGVNSGETYTLPDYISGGIVTVNSACDILTYDMVQNPIAGTEVPVGTHPVTITTTSSTGQVVTCEFDVIVTEVVNVEDYELYNSIVLYPNPVSEILIRHNNSTE